MMRVDDIPVRRCVPISEPVNRLVARDTQATSWGSTVVRGIVTDENIAHRVIRRPQGRFVDRDVTDRRGSVIDHRELHFAACAVWRRGSIAHSYRDRV